ARRSREAVREVVDELHLSGEGPFRAVTNSPGPSQRVCGAPCQRGGIDLRLYLPLNSRLGSRDRSGTGIGLWDRRQLRGKGPLEGVQREDRDIRGWLCRRGPREGVERLEGNVRRR